MNFVKIVRSGNISRLEEEINTVLLDNLKSKFVDLKYSSTTRDDRLVHTVIVIFEQV